VDFPRGRVTEWYPRARPNGGGVAWGQVRVMPGAPVQFPCGAAGSHYYAARETDAAPLRVGDEHEKFLFYRGLGSFNLPLSIRLDGDQVVIRSPADFGPAIVFESRRGRAGFSVAQAQAGEVRVARPSLREPDPEPLRRRLQGILVSQGLYPKEAHAMVETWRDTWFEDGLRVFYWIPRPLTDELLPLTIQPKPAELVRVLVARTELIPDDPVVAERLLRWISPTGSSAAAPR